MRDDRDYCLKIKPAETDRLRCLASRIAEIAVGTDNIECRDAWLTLHDGGNHRPMILAEPEAIRDSDFPLNNLPLECESPSAREVERELMATIWKSENLRDDRVVLPYWNLNWQVEISGYGVDTDEYYAEKSDEDRFGSYGWEPALPDFERDFPRLKQRSFRVDRDATLSRRLWLEGLFEGILEVRMRGSFWWSMGLTMTAVRLLGMEKMMLMMYDNPEGLHRLMAFLRDDHLALVEWLEEEGLLSLNNENDYIGSGSCGYTTRPSVVHEVSPEHKVQLRDLWVLGESQETVGVSPDLFEEFVLQYQKPILERFGASYYGCCEPLHDRIHLVKKLTNLRKVSVSPWADQEKMAQALGKDYVYSRKPSPNLISGNRLDPDLIRHDLRQTLEIAGECRLEFIMRTVITLNNEPERLARWVELARQA